jgi:hypothetical protein
VLEYDDQPASGTYVDVWGGELVGADGTTTAVDFNREPVGSRAVVGLWRQRVRRACEDGGVLTLFFDSGDALRALADDRYESWTVSFAGRVYQCLPGGDILEY